MVFAAALLLVAASSGFLGGPTVLAWMAIDKWAPHSFAHLSNKLVAQNGVLTMGTAAGILLLFTGGQVHSLVVLYSINVFLTFSLSLAGLARYNLTHRREMKFGQWLSPDRRFRCWRADGRRVDPDHAVRRQVQRRARGSPWWWRC